jgi:hypothetical protein
VGRPLLALALLSGALAAGAQHASTAGSTLPSSTLEYGQMKVVGGTALHVTYTSLGQTTSGFTVRIAGGLTLKTVTASYDGSGSLTCLKGALVGTLLTGYTPVSCTGLAGRPGFPNVTVNIS